MSNKQIVRPRLSLLNTQQMDQIHDDALRIIFQTGVRVYSIPVIDFLVQKLGRAAVRDDILRMPAEVVERALKQAPKVIDVADFESFFGCKQGIR